MQYRRTRAANRMRLFTAQSEARGNRRKGVEDDGHVLALEPAAVTRHAATARTRAAAARTPGFPDQPAKDRSPAAVLTHPAPLIPGPIPTVVC